MKQITHTIVNSVGLTSKHCAELVAEANYFESCSLLLINNTTEESADLKSIMNVMALILRTGESFTIKIDGKQEIEALKKITELIKSLSI